MLGSSWGMTVRVVTFNIAHGRGRDRRVDFGRTAALINGLDADAVLLQEVDRHFGQRSGWHDQLTLLGELCGLTGVFGSSLRRRPSEPDRPPREYGNAVLTRWPVAQVETIGLPGRRGEEPRSLLLARLTLPGGPLTVGSVHLQHTSAATRAEQIAAVLAAVGDIDPLVLGGDLNAGPETAELGLLTSALRDVWVSAGEGAGATFPGHRPRARIDHLVTSASLRPVAAWVVPSDASDHLPLVADLEYPAAGLVR